MKILFSEKQRAFLAELCPAIDASRDLSDEEYFALDEAVSDCLARKGTQGEYEPTEIGLMCESILDILAEVE